MATIEKRPREDGKVSWRASVRLKGHPTYSETFEIKEDAELWASNLEASLKGGSFIFHTMKDVFDRYEHEILPQKSAYQMKDEKFHIPFWREHLGERKLNEVTSLEIEQILSSLVEKTSSTTGRLLSASTARKYLMTLSYIFNICAREWKWSNNNPASFVSRDNSSNATKIKKDTPKDLISLKMSLIDQLKSSMLKLRNPSIKGLSREVNVSPETIRRALDPCEDITLRTISNICSSLNIKAKLVFEE